MVAVLRLVMLFLAAIVACEETPRGDAAVLISPISKDDAAYPSK